MMDELGDLQDTNIPEVVKQFLYLAREHGQKMRRLVDIYKLSPDLYERLLEREDFNALEDIVDAIADQKDEGSFMVSLKHALMAFYPLERPLFCQKLAQCVNKMSGPITWDTIMAFKENPKIEGSQLENLFNTTPLTLQGTIKTTCLEAFDVASLAGQNDQKPFKLAFSKSLGTKFGECFPRSNKQHSKAELNTEESRENWLFYSALCDLVLGNYENLDPVIGDEACEARPSVLIDIRENFLICAGDAEILKYWARGYQRRHRDDAIGRNLRIAQDGSWSQMFVSICDKFIVTYEAVDVRPYISLCKANTIASTMAADEWGIVSYDRDKGIFAPDVKAQKRSRLTEASLRQIRNMAAFVCSQMTSEHGIKFARQVRYVLEAVNASKEDNGFPIFSLPIYETMRTVMAYECLKGRHVVLSLYHVACEPTGDNEDSPAKYRLLDIDTIVYKGNPKTGKFELCSLEGLDPSMQCVAFQGYHLYNAGSQLAVNDGCDFFAASDLEAYRQGFGACDFTTQIMLYSAVHPVLVHGCKLGSMELPDSGSGHVKGLQKSITGSEGWGTDCGPLTRKTSFTLLDPVCDLFTEYSLLVELGLRVGVANKQYMTRPGGKQTCVRTLVSCSFSIHHINVQSLGWVINRNQLAKTKGDLERFHNFDTGASYNTKSSADDANKKGKS